MTHRVTLILDACEQLAQVPSVANDDGTYRVNRSARPHEGGPGIGVRLEDWQTTDLGSNARATAEADIAFYITAAEVEENNVDATLLQVDAELHAVMIRDQRPFLGLDFVIDVDRQNFPTDANAEGNLPTGSAIARYRVQFTYPRENIEA